MDTKYVSKRNRKLRIKWFPTVLIVLLVLLLVPIPIFLRDGNVILQAVLYRVEIDNSIPDCIPDGQGGIVMDENGEPVLGRLRGFTFEVPGFLDEGWEIIDTTRYVPVEPND